MKIIRGNDPGYAKFDSNPRKLQNDQDAPNTMEKRELKKKILDACITKQRSLIDDFKVRIQSLTETVGLGNEEAYDNFEQAANASKISEINALNELLEFANQEMELLQNLKITPDLIPEQASLGAVVVTDRNTFLISASIEDVTVNGKKYIGISTKSPLFQAMHGKSRGETFTYKGIAYKIKEIF